MTTIQIDQWWNCYSDQWGDELVPEAFAHPAKIAPGLSKKIYDHAFEMGWLCAGNRVVDPFGGIAGTALQAMIRGLSWVGCELEQRFVDLGSQNIALWCRRYSLWPKLGSAVLLQGDSRNLRSVIGGAADVCVSSPPYEGQELDYGDRPNRAAKIANIPNFKGRTHWQNNDKTITHYGDMGSGDSFWSAAKLIVAQTHSILRPGGHAMWVVKDFVRNKEIVPFCDQWRQLCESCGFVTLHEHHAMLIAEASQIGFDGEHKRRERKSFFRRLAESHGSPRIDYEVVSCMEKPNGR